MDTPRRWQVASSVTAVAGLSIGALMLGRPASQPVETIDLDRLTMVESGSGDQQVPSDRPADIFPTYAPSEPDEQEIVRPRVIEDQLSDDTTAPVVTADDSPEPVDSPESDDSPEPADSPESDDSPESVDSPESDDSPGSD